MIASLLLLLPLQAGGLEEALTAAADLAAKNNLSGAVQVLKNAGVEDTEDGNTLTVYGGYVMRWTEGEIAAGRIAGLDAIDAWTDVAELLERACGMPGAPDRAWVVRSEAVLNAGDVADALEVVDAGLSERKGSAQILMQRGRVLMALARQAEGTGDGETRDKRYADAESAFQTAMDAAPKSAAPCERLGELLWTLWHAGERQDDDLKARAIAAFTTGAERDPHGIDLGNLNNWLGADSVAPLDVVAAARDDDALVYWYRGMAHYAAGAESWAELKADFEKVLELNPQFTNAYYFLADGAMKRGVWHATRQGGSEAQANAAYRASAGYWADYLKDFGTNYRADLARAADGGRGMAETMNYLAGRLVSGLMIPRDNLDDGIALLEWTVTLAPDYGDAWQNLGFFHREAGSYARAREAYARAHELMPEDPQVMNDYAVIHHYYLKDEDELALDLYERAVRRAEELLDSDQLADEDRGRIQTALRDARSNLEKLKKGNRSNR